MTTTEKERDELKDQIIEVLHTASEHFSHAGSKEKYRDDECNQKHELGRQEHRKVWALYQKLEELGGTRPAS